MATKTIFLHAVAIKTGLFTPTTITAKHIRIAVVKLSAIGAMQ
ncbi:MAG: hypothetical protein QNK95_11840 [Paracoccaceae bacterium]